MTFSGQVALVTGAAAGIGRATAQAFLVGVGAGGEAVRQVAAGQFAPGRAGFARRVHPRQVIAGGGDLGPHGARQAGEGEDEQAGTHDPHCRAMTRTADGAWIRVRCSGSPPPPRR